MSTLLRRTWASLEEVLAAISFAVVVVAVAVNVFMRYVLHDDLLGASEIATTMYLWTVMLGVGAVTRRRMHPAIDFFVSALPGSVGAVVAILVQMLVIYVLADLTLSAWQFAWGSGFNKFTGALKLPYFYTYLALPIGLGLMLLRAAVNLLADLRAVFGRASVEGVARSDVAGTAESLPRVS